jgi:hypothetical protein
MIHVSFVNATVMVIMDARELAELEMLRGIFSHGGL